MVAETLAFPPSFVWGTSTASYQIEGAWDLGKGWSIWDAFSHTQGGVKNNDNGDIACDHYHKFEQDIKTMAGMGIKHYRFSIAWTRIQPTGRGPRCAEGVAFYNRLIDALLAAGITPIICLYHWDLPLALQLEFGGWLGREVVDCFDEYSKICFECFGDRVKTWLTFNEPWCITVLGHGTGEHAPGIVSADASKVYLSGHNLLLSHARAVQRYRSSFQAAQGGKIGITLNANYSFPKPTDDPVIMKRNQEAAERAMLFNLGWFAEPIWGGKGNYPQVMIDTCGDRLPVFSDEEKSQLNGSSDFFGLNHYSSDLVEDATVSSPQQLQQQQQLQQPHEAGGHMVVDEPHVDEGCVTLVNKPKTGMSVEGGAEEGAGGFWGDMKANFSYDASWGLTDMGWSVVPEGFGCLLTWIHNRYHPAGGIIVTENGCAVHEPTREIARADHFRVEYYNAYVASMHAVMQQGVDVRGYFTWTLMDNFEWALGYCKRFGLYWVDYDSPKLERYPKLSALWFAKTIKDNAISVPTANLAFPAVAIATTSTSSTSSSTTSSNNSNATTDSCRFEEGAAIKMDDEPLPVAETVTC